MPSADPRAPSGFGACVGRDDDPALRVWTPGENRRHPAGQVGQPSGTAPSAAAQEAPTGAGPRVLHCGNLSSIHDLIDVTLRHAWPVLDLDTAAPNVEFSR